MLDRHSRRVRGLVFGVRMEVDLPAAALRQAIQHRGGRLPPGLLHHSDQSVQYASERYQALLTTHAITPSRSRRANCYDNAQMESFGATLKAEALATRLEARLAIFNYVESFDNRRRLHSALGYLSPVDFEQLTYELNPPHRFPPRPPNRDRFTEFMLRAYGQGLGRDFVFESESSIWTCWRRVRR